MGETKATRALPRDEKGRPLLDGAVILWRPHPGFQTEAIQDGCDDTFFGGAAGPGKTDVLIVKMARAAQHKGCRGLFLRTSFTDLRDVMDRMLVLYPALGGAYSPSQRRWSFEAVGGGTVELGYGKNLAQIARYLGRQFTHIAFDEIGLLADEVPWQLLLTRLRSPDASVPLRAWSSANPGGAGHAWLKARYVSPSIRTKGRPWRDTETGLVRNYVRGRADKDNPSLPASYWERLKGLPPAMVKAMREGDWDAGLGMFYPEVQGQVASFLVPRETLPTEMGRLPAWWEYWGSYDWGFRHPSVALWFARDDTGCVYVLDALYQHRAADTDQAVAIAKRRWRPTEAYPDGELLPAECMQHVYAGSDAFFVRQAHATVPDTVQDVFNRAGVGLERANLDRVTGSATVRRSIMSGGLKFVDTIGCRRLLSELGGLVPDPNTPEAPLKVDANPDTGMGGDDGPDALRYGLATPLYVPFVPVQQAKKGNVTRGADDDDFLDRPNPASEHDPFAIGGGDTTWNGTVTGFG